MKLLNVPGCLFPGSGGNEGLASKQQTMIVEGQGMDFWTRVRLPPIPCYRKARK